MDIGYNKKNITITIFSEAVVTACGFRMNSNTDYPDDKGDWLAIVLCRYFIEFELDGRGIVLENGRILTNISPFFEQASIFCKTDDHHSYLVEKLLVYMLYDV